MSWLKGVFGGGSTRPEAEPETYKGFTILPQPIREGTSFRISALIEKEIDGEVKTHTLIRADTLGELTAATDASIGKAKQLIEEQGDAIFV